MSTYDDIRLEDGYMIEEKVAQLTDHELHTHDALEISVVLDNRIRFKTPNRDYYGNPGDIFLYRPFEPHWTLIEPDRPPARWIMLLFSPGFAGRLPDGNQLLTPFYSVRTEPLIPADAPLAADIRRAALDALEEQKARRFGWETRRFLRFADALTLIRRHYAETAGSAGAEGAADSRLERVIPYMLSHLGEEIGTDELIALSGLGKNQFFQGFRDLTGLAPGRFLLRLRLQHAAYLLQYTDRPVTDIALECGFGSVSYFNRRFKEYSGLAPTEHRREHRRRSGAAAPGGAGHGGSAFDGAPGSS